MTRDGKTGATPSAGEHPNCGFSVQLTIVRNLFLLLDQPLVTEPIEVLVAMPATEKQQDAESCEREYKQFLNEVGLDPNAVNNRGLDVVEATAEDHG